MIFKDPNDKGGNYFLNVISVIQSITDILNEKLFNNIIPGQNIVVVYYSFETQITKVSAINPKSICAASTDNPNENQKRRVRIRRLEDTEECGEESALALNKSLITNLMSNDTSANVGFQSQLNKNKNIAVETNSTREIFSKTSMKFTIQTEKPISIIHQKDSEKNIINKI